MTLDKVREIAATYKKKLNDKARYLGAKKADENIYETIDRERHAHILYMLENLEKLCDEGRVEKTMRWLGFIQGVLWTTGVFSLEDIKHHCMPKDQEYKEDAR